MPRIEGAPVQRIVRGETHGNFRSVGAADDDGTRIAKIADEWRVVVGDEIGEGWDSVGGCVTSLVYVHLDCDRDTEERPLLGQRLEFLIGGGCLGERLIGEIDDNCI